MNSTFSAGKEQRLLETLFRVTISEISDNLFYGAIKGLFTIAIGNSLFLAFGPFAYFLPLASFATFATKIGVKTYISLENQKQQSTLYRVSTTKENLLVVENTNSNGLKEFPIQLPQSHRIPVYRLGNIEQEIKELQPQRFDYKKFYQPLHQEIESPSFFSYTCPDCKGSIRLAHDQWLGHAPLCFFNPDKAVYLNRSSDNVCKDCQQKIVWVNGVPEGHRADCLQFPRKLPREFTTTPRWGVICPECRQQISLVSGKWVGHLHTCSKH